MGGTGWFFNPLRGRGVLVLNKEARLVLESVDEKLTVDGVWRRIARYGEIGFSNFKACLLSLEEKGLIFEVGKKPEVILSHSTCLGAWLQMTDNCNLACRYCYVSKEPRMMEKNCRRGVLREIFRVAQEGNFKKVKMKFSGGEPFLAWPAVLEMAREAREEAARRGLGWRGVVLTNATLLTAGRAEEMRREDLRAAVSLDGWGEVNDRTRILIDGGGSFNLAWRGIEILQRAKVGFNVSVTVTKENVFDLPFLVKELMIRKIPFVFNFYRGSDGWRAKDEDLVRGMKAAYEEIGRNFYEGFETGGLLDRVSFDRPHSFCCGAGRSYLVFRTDGKLSFCQMRLAEGEESLTAVGGWEIWRHKMGVLEREFNGKKRCEKCRWRYFCAGGCPWLGRQQDYCGVYQQLIPAWLVLEAKRVEKFGFKSKEARK